MKPGRIKTDDNNLSCNAEGMISVMLNCPMADYSTAENLCTVFVNDSLKTITSALEELINAGYVHKIGDRYAINKIKITQMKVV